MSPQGAKCWTRPISRWIGVRVINFTRRADHVVVKWGALLIIFTASLQQAD